jgi:tetratricopeptide (TPR) repeat protein
VSPRNGDGNITLVAALVVAVTVAGARAQVARGDLATPPSGRILVMPFENATRDSRIVWLGEASAVLLADDLNARGAGAITREERREAFDRLQVPPVATLTDATVIRIGQLVGAGEVVVGSLELDGDALVVRARSITLDTGRVRATVLDKGAMSDLFAIFDRIAQQMVPASTAANAPARPALPLPAFENYIKGLLAETPATQISYLEAALSLYRGYDRARLALWDVYTDEGEHEQALAAVQQVANSSPWSRRATFLAGLSELQLKKYEDAFDAFTRLADERPTASVLNDLGVVQLRRGPSPPGGLATYYFNKAAEADPSDPDYFFNLGYAYWQAKDTPAAVYWLREAVRRNPSDADAHFVLGTALGASGNGIEAAREKELARRLSSTYETRDKRSGGEVVPRDLERIKSGVELPHASSVETTLASSEQRDQQQLAVFYLERGRRLYEQEHDREALVQLNRALYLSPYDADAQLLVGRIALREGRVRDAIDAFYVALWSRETAEGHVALADAYIQSKDDDAARAEVERALAMDPASAAAKRLLEQLGPKP